MSKFTLLTRLNRNNVSFRHQPKSRNFNFGVRGARFLIISLVIGLGIFYLVATNYVSTLGFKLRSLQDQADQLRINNEKLQIQAAEKQSLQRIEEISKELNLVANGPVKYLETGSSSVAAK